jgi:hypothetical protein
LQGKFPLPGQPEILFLHHFVVIINETNGAKSQHRKHRDPYVSVLKIAPKQRRHDCRAYNQNTAHGGRPGFGLVAFGSFFPNELSDLQVAEPLNDSRPEQEGNQQRRDAGEGSPHSDIAEHIERVKIPLEQVVEEIEQHLSHAPWAHWLLRMPPALLWRARSANQSPRRFVPS